MQELFICIDKTMMGYGKVYRCRLVLEDKHVDILEGIFHIPAGNWEICSTSSGQWSQMSAREFEAKFARVE